MYKKQNNTTENSDKHIAMLYTHNSKMILCDHGFEICASSLCGYCKVLGYVYPSFEGLRHVRNFYASITQFSDNLLSVMHQLS